MSRKTVIFINLLILGISLQAQDIRVKLFHYYPVTEAVYSISEGQYKFTADGEFFSVFKKGNVFHLTVEKGLIAVRDKQKLIGKFEEVSFNAIKEVSYGMIRPVTPSLDTRLYDDDMEISVKNNQLQIINKVDLEKYIAGVIESEGGPNAPAEYYKAQAVLIRTFAIKNMFKHAGEGFNLCDGVHCQAYKSKSRLNDSIYEATLATAGEVLADTDSNLIMASYHANCGGQTNTAENYWQKSLPYLVSVNDPFCKNGKHAYWEKTMPLNKWTEYLINRSVDVFEINKVDNFTFYQKNRARYYTTGNIRVPLRSIREDFDLKSTFFSVVQNDNSIKIKGRGYGHGIGLCQEGAIEMARVGYCYIDILHFYYKDVHLTDYRTLDLKNYH